MSPKELVDETMVCFVDRESCSAQFAKMYVSLFMFLIFSDEKVCHLIEVLGRLNCRTSVNKYPELFKFAFKVPNFLVDNKRESMRVDGRSVFSKYFVSRFSPVVAAL
jgi:hypothetical protein